MWTLSLRQSDVLVTNLPATFLKVEQPHMKYDQQRKHGQLNGRQETQFRQSNQGATVVLLQNFGPKRFPFRQATPQDMYISKGFFIKIRCSKEQMRVDGNHTF